MRASTSQLILSMTCSAVLPINTAESPVLPVVPRITMAALSCLAASGITSSGNPCWTSVCSSLKPCFWRRAFIAVR
ncbi:Uncharacterised protein [Vibrio cholerae]|nr:Uncharacterised protein [Vibrio cholerae]